jgi:hypothetical protein
MVMMPLETCCLRRLVRNDDAFLRLQMLTFTTDTFNLVFKWFAQYGPPELGPFQRHTRVSFGQVLKLDIL